MMRPGLLLTGEYPAADMAALADQYDIIKLWEAGGIAALSHEARARIRAIGTRGDLGASAELMAALPNLEMVAVFGVGVDGVDLPYARNRNIAVSNTPDVLTDDVADLAVALVFGIARQIPDGDRFVRSGSWPQRSLPLGARVSGKRVGIAGMGRIGAATARRMAAFGCPITYFSRTPKTGLPWRHVAGIADLARQSDYLIVTIAGGAGTANLIDADALAALGPDGYLINVSRGSTVDEEALIVALQQKRIKGAALDVFRNEPDIDPRFLDLDNVVLQPHQGSATVETRAAIGQLVRDNLQAHFSGEPLITPVV